MSGGNHMERLHTADRYNWRQLTIGDTIAAIGHVTLVFCSDTVFSRGGKKLKLKGEDSPGRDSICNNNNNKKKKKKSLNSSRRANKMGKRGDNSKKRRRTFAEGGKRPKNKFPVDKVDGDNAKEHGACDVTEKSCPDAPCKAQTHFNKQVVKCVCSAHLCNRNLTWRRELEESVPSASKDPTWVIIVATVLVLCLVIVALLLRCLSQHKKNRRASLHISPMSPCQTTHTSQIDVTDVQLEQIVDRGHFATVWRATYQGSAVAVKVIPPAAKHAFIAEKEVYKLPLMRHASIIHFLGAGRRSDDGSWLLVLQIAEYGSLHSFLRLNTSSWPTSLKLCLSLSQGLSYLHSDLHTKGHKPPVAHRDLCSFNVLVQADGTCALCDFGNSNILWPHSGHRQMGNAKSHSQTPGTLCYMSPEILEGSVNLRSWWCLHGDVYALGLVLWEICMRCSDLFEDAAVPQHLLPYERELGGLLTWESLIIHVFHKDLRPSIPEHWQLLRQGPELQDLLRECWDWDPEARLTAECVVNRLNSL
ncbi:bone morphogenetic protein receptor type-2-like isoform X2 [Phycodurus eques]|uniref:bone morphogenetic protein receptor type-2-like isoform X2 n=1 Tax=Phycodurus eques TaxID=693459 RepID=UPI002ACE5D1E|nr:bone morphogenetic protein receptor type-2-like isoform X2 [Phycodurus eques]